MRRSARTAAVLGVLVVASACVSALPLATPTPSRARVLAPLPTGTLPPPAATPTAPPLTTMRCTERFAMQDVEHVVVAKWSPDSRRLAVGGIWKLPTAKQPTGYEEELVLETFDLRDGARLAFGIGSLPEWSGSGALLSYWSPDGEELHVVQDGELRANLPATIPEVRWVGDTLLFFSKDQIRIWSEGAMKEVARVAIEYEPHYPRDDVHWSADGERFTLTRYGRDGIDRWIGITRTGAVTPLEVRGASHVEWSPAGHTLLVRYPDRLELRTDESVQRTALSRFAGPVHVWTPDGRGVLLGKVSPTTPGGDVVDEFRPWGTSAAPDVALLPNLLGARSFSPNGEYFTGVSRTSLHGTRLEIYRCGGGQAAPTAPLAAAWRAALARDPRRFLRPTAGEITQFVTPGHSGLDIAAPLGSLVTAADDGIVSAIGVNQADATGGERVCLQHTIFLESCYYHLAAQLVGRGERVLRGQPIALIGMTGVATGPHVHWEVKLAGRIVDPLTR